MSAPSVKLSKPALTCSLLFCAALALYCANLGQSTLWSRDETTYAEMARHMLRSGEWITLQWNGRPWFNHPPLFYWLMALDFRALGINEFAARFPSAVFGAAGVALTYLWGRSALSSRSAFYAALCMMLNLQYFLESRFAIIDTTFLFFLSLSLLGFWRGWRQRAGYGPFFAACGLACLTKGPWGLIFPFVVILPFTVLQKTTHRLRELPWLWGLPLAFGVGGAWYAIEILRHGSEFTRTVLGYYFLGRITTQVEHQGGPVWMYVPIILGGFFPWSFLLPSAIGRLWSRRKRDDGVGLFLLCWIVFPFLGLSLASTKLPSYAAFIFAPCALAVGAWLDDAESDPTRLRVAFSFASLSSLSLVMVLHTWGESHLAVPLAAIRCAEVMFACMAAGLLLSVGVGVKTKAMPALPAFIGTLVGLLVLILLGEPSIEPERDLSALCNKISHIARPDETIAIYGPGVFGAIYYADHGPMIELRDPEQLRRLSNDRGRALVIMRYSTFIQLDGSVRSALHVVGTTGREVLLRKRSQQ